MDAVRAAVAEMQAEEGNLLDQRTEKTTAARRLTKIVTSTSTLMGVVLMLLIGLAIRREINKSSQMRGELRALNADLEQRVEQRTAVVRETSATSVCQRDVEQGTPPPRADSVYRLIRLGSDGGHDAEPGTPRLPVVCVAHRLAPNSGPHRALGKRRLR